MKFRKEFEWLREKPLVLLFAEGISVDNGGLFKGSWDPNTGGGFGGSGIAETTFREEICMGWFIETYISKLPGGEKPQKIGFCHAPGAMRSWLLSEVME